MSDYKHWKLETDSQNILWLALNRANSSVNTLNAEVMHEFNIILDKISPRQFHGLIIYSAKASGFIAGADIDEFEKIETYQDAFSLIRDGQKTYDKLAALNVPTVALIKGFCMGGGLELALACDYRIAQDDENTRLGLPEVKLGIQPGWGGSVRLPRLIGVFKAMDVILSGRSIRSKAAQRMGFVDAAVPDRQMENAARSFILNKPPKHNHSLFDEVLSFRLFRPLVGWLLYRQLHKKKVNPSHYPAPYAIVKHWITHGAHGEAAFLTEAESISELMVSPTSRNLVRVFFLQNRLKEAAKGIQFEPKHIHVIGAGTMGGDIAAWCALKGFNATLQDREPKLIAPAIKRAYKLYQKQLKDQRAIQIAMDHLTPDPQGLGVKKADIIIEAIFENLEAKQKLFKELETHAKPGAILASNTSSIPLDEINSVMQQPERLVGIHFFNPVAIMPLIEVVKGAKTDQDTAKKANKFVTIISKSPIEVKSSPGFLVNRVLLAYMMEAVMMLEEGVPAANIDRAAVEFGMPMGPIELGDTVGLDICLSVAKNLQAAFGGDKVPEVLVQKVEKGQLGKKTGRGFYTFNKQGKAIIPKVKSAVPPDAQTRMFGRMLNESVACLREGVVENADILDAGMIFGTGFAPFRGGPIQYAKTRGIENVVHELNELTEKYGPRFKPDAGWDQLKGEPHGT